MITPIFLNNRYKVIRVLGSGGFGETFLAEDTQMPSGRRCVIKQLKPVADNPQVYQLVRERFAREAAILEELGGGSHQIPALYAYFEENGLFYLVQEHIDGKTLTQKLQNEGRLSESSVKEIIANILTILDYVHSKGIVHRDIKPDNIIIRDADNKPVLIDFGAVKETMGTVMTASGNSSRSIVIGTPGYMPSEQSVGRPVFSSDLYSLGLTAIYSLTGKIPQELATNYTTGEIIWREHANSVTPSFAIVIDKAIQPFAPNRFSSAKEMLQALRTGVNPIPSTAPVSTPQATMLSPAPVGGQVGAYAQPQIAQPQAVQPQTLVSAQAAGYYQATPVTQKGVSDWQKAVIMGGVIGSFLVGGLWLSRGHNSTQQQATQPQTTQTQTTQTQATQTQATQPQETQPKAITSSPSLSSSQATAPDASNSPANNTTQQQPLPTIQSLPAVQQPPAIVNPAPARQSQPVPVTASISRADATAVIAKWIGSKPQIFAAPYNRQLGEELLTGEAYRKNIGAGSSLEWLQNNNAYYRYGVQKLDSVESFAASGDQATIDVVVTEDRTLYKSNGTIDPEQTAFDTRLVRYSLQMENGQPKISDYKSINVISKR
jgi:serine/threonine protein kinase